MKISLTYLDSGWFVISDRSASFLAKKTAHGKLPRHGYSLGVKLPDGGATLQRTQSILFERRRWRWALYGEGVNKLLHAPEYHSRHRAKPQTLEIT